MKGRIADRDTSNKRRFQPRNWRHGAGPTYLKLNITYGCQFLFCGKLMRNRPSRCTRDEAEFTLEIESVDLVNDTVNVVGQRVAFPANIAIVGKATVNPVDHLTLRTNFEPPFIDLIENFAVSVRQRSNV